MDDEGEDLLVFLSFGKGTFVQRFGFWKVQWIFTNAVETGVELCGERLACFDARGNSDLAGAFEKIRDFLAEVHGLPVGMADGNKLFTDFLALAQQVCEAGLTTSAKFDGIV